MSLLLFNLGTSEISQWKCGYFQTFFRCQLLDNIPEHALLGHLSYASSLYFRNTSVQGLQMTDDKLQTPSFVRLKNSAV